MACITTTEGRRDTPRVVWMEKVANTPHTTVRETRCLPRVPRPLLLAAHPHTIIIHLSDSFLSVANGSWLLHPGPEPAFSAACLSLAREPAGPLMKRGPSTFSTNLARQPGGKRKSQLYVTRQRPGSTEETWITSWLITPKGSRTSTVSWLGDSIPSTSKMIRSPKPGPSTRRSPISSGRVGPLMSFAPDHSASFSGCVSRSQTRSAGAPTTSVGQVVIDITAPRKTFRTLARA